MDDVKPCTPRLTASKTERTDDTIDLLVMLLSILETSAIALEFVFVWFPAVCSTRRHGGPDLLSETQLVSSSTPSSPPRMNIAPRGANRIQSLCSTTDTIALT